MHNVETLLETLFVKYWSQITLVLLGFGYLIKRILDRKSKKREINHTLFQQNKHSAIIEYFNEYNKMESLYLSFPIREILDNKIATNEIYEKFMVPINNFRHFSFSMSIYFKPDVLKNFVDIHRYFNDFNEVTIVLAKNELGLGPQNFDSQKYYSDYNSMVNATRESLAKITVAFRTDFNQKLFH